MPHKWEELTEAVNRINKVNLNEKQMLEYMYKLGGSIRRAADLLGVHYKCFGDRLRHHNIPINPPGGGFRSVLKDIDFTGKTVTQIANEANCSRNTVYEWANAHNIEYKRVKLGRPRIG